MLQCDYSTDVFKCEPESRSETGQTLYMLIVSELYIATAAREEKGRDADEKQTDITRQLIYIFQIDYIFLPLSRSMCNERARLWEKTEKKKKTKKQNT